MTDPGSRQAGRPDAPEGVINAARLRFMRRAGPGALPLTRSRLRLLFPVIPGYSRVWKAPGSLLFTRFTVGKGSREPLLTSFHCWERLPRTSLPPYLPTWVYHPGYTLYIPPSVYTRVHTPPCTPWPADGALGSNPGIIEPGRPLCASYLRRV